MYLSNDINTQRMIDNYKRKEKLEMPSILVRKVVSLTRNNRIIIITSQNKLTKSFGIMPNMIRIYSLLLHRHDSTTFSNILMKSNVLMPLLDKEILRMKKILPSTPGIKQIAEYLWDKMKENYIRTLCIIISGKMRSKRASNVTIKKVNMYRELRSHKQNKVIIRRKHLLSTGLIGIKIILY